MRGCSSGFFEDGSMATWLSRLETIDQEDGQIDISEMSREELVQLVIDSRENLELDVLKQALDRIDEIDGVKKSESDTLIDEINEDAFDSLPIEKQLEKLIQASQALVDEAKKYGIDL